ncbi:posphoenolpyruvate synthetase regulatory kinase/phosphorylase PpsR [Legionella yabuuchiae]|uniref:posphoenolpyruvate synthetase regulatory kinase/phosphorylase PpsR n=1 Tax=Legionella yabuuchiae TaxID=376727 RepID=UPI001056A6C3|nr:pyruvate, water dikinase regulatory protein [Legionella yabuuchiae]
MKRQVYMVSDGTGITAESLGNSLLTQFETVTFEKQTIPYIDCVEKAEKIRHKLDQDFEETGIKPIVFLTSVNPGVSTTLKKANACILDLFNTFLSPLELELNIKSSYTVGRTHGVSNPQSYDHRIEAVNYALAHDDGVKIKEYDKADIILIGVSRCGKTPSCLYMALQFGILAANYPFTDEELRELKLPSALKPYKAKLFGLTIDPIRLHQIRSERRPDSQYASMEQCRVEIFEVEEMYKLEKIPYLNSTRYSIEEISTKIIATAGIKRKM